MKLALFDSTDGLNRLGLVVEGADGKPDTAVVDVTAALPWPHDPDPLTGGWWRALCRDFGEVGPKLAELATAVPAVGLDTVTLRAPVLAPSKVVAAASNYGDHVAEMHEVQERAVGRVESWLLEFDVFLMATSSIIGPGESIVLPAEVLAKGDEVHHESELVVVIGRGGKDIPVETALDHVLGFTGGLDITVRATGDRSKRKSYDTFSPVGPWITTADEVEDGSNLDITLLNRGEVKQSVSTADMLTPVPQLIAYASTVMTLLPGDLLFTGAPPGVGPIAPGDVLDMSISRIGAMRVDVRV